MKKPTTDLSFFKKFKVTKSSHAGAGPLGLLAAEDTPVPEKKASAPTGVLPEDEVLDVIIKNPGMNAATFYNQLKAKGMRIVQEAARVKKAKEGGPGSGPNGGGGGGDSGGGGGISAKDAHQKAKDEKKALGLNSTKDSAWHDVAKSANKVDQLRAQLDKMKAEYKSTFGKDYKAGKEADSASANAQVLRQQKKESLHKISILSRFMEGAASDNGVGFTKFRVVLIQEGLGNLKDAYYYTREALASAVPVFEGKKIYADHPSAIDEQTRPERSVKDVLGHFEDVELVEDGKGGPAQLEANLIILPEEPYRWARALMTHSVEFSKKYPDKDFIGLSINAAGDAEPKNLLELMKSVPDEARIKLQKAQAEGIETVRLVTLINDAISCDLVTEAGAGGKVLEMLEKEQKMKKKNMKENDKEVLKKEEADPAAADASAKADGADKADGHDDKQQDVELIKKMIAEHLGSEETESDEVMKMCKEAYEAYTEMGYEADDAMQATGHAMKLAKHMANKEAKEADPVVDKKEEKKEEGADPVIPEKKEAAADDKKKDDEGDVKESNVKLTAEIAGLKDTLKGIQLERHVEKTLSESGLPRSATTLFKEKAGTFKSIADVDSKFKLFVETYKAVRGSETGGLDFIISSEKREDSAGVAVTFEDCVS